MIELKCWGWLVVRDALSAVNLLIAISLTYSCTFSNSLWAEEVLSDNQVTVYRDTWGVPHVYANTESAGAYGLGYAQAEDRLDDLHSAVRTGMGSMSEAFGAQYVQQDYLMRQWRNAELAQSYWQTAPEYVKQLVGSFVAGVKAYQAKHPDRIPEHAVELEPWMILTIGRAMTLRWPVGTIMDDLKEGQRRRDASAQGAQGPAERSNQWVVAASRSADHVPILLTDPHLTWEGLAVLYEARVHAGDLHMNGYFLIGSPLVGIGHNRHVGWAMTTGGPDTSDVYEIKFRVLPKPQYEYDGEWRDVEVKMLSIPVKGQAAVTRPAFYTHLGPVMSEPDMKNGRAMVGASPYFEQTGLFEQSYRMAKAQNIQEFFDALGMNQFNEQNLMFADTHGHIGYLRSGATPIRPEGYDWSAPVPGFTSETAWKGLHPPQDLVHLFDPPQGYMQNCNISPQNMLADSPLTPDKYADYIYNVSWDSNNPRSRRILHLLAGNDSVTEEQAMSYAMDVHDDLAEVWQKELREAVAGIEKAGAEVNGAANAGLESPEFKRAVQAILAWDGEFTPEARATSLYQFWRLKCGEELDLSLLAERQSLRAAARLRMLELLVQTMAEMKDKYGSWDIAWGDIHKVGRGGQLFPVGGTDFQSGNHQANFSETLFDVRSKPDADHPGHFVANSGSMAMLLMFFHPDGIKSYSCTPWGQTTNPQSPHYMDQGEKLYSPRRMKPTWWKRAELMPNVQSTTTLTLSP